MIATQTPATMNHFRIMGILLVVDRYWTPAKQAIVPSLVTTVTRPLATAMPPWVGLAIKGSS